MEIKSPPVALLIIELHIPASESLKDRRQAVTSVKERLKGHYNVSVAEIGDTEKWQLATLAICAVSSDGRRLGQLMQAIVRKIDSWRIAEIIQHQIEIL